MSNKSKTLFTITAVVLLTAEISLNAQENMLNRKQEKIVTIAAFAAKGELDKLTSELNAGLDAGLTVNEIKEVLVHLYAYSGFPRSIRGLQTFMTALDQRKAAGINDNWGREASPVSDTRDKYERGKEVLERLTGVAVEGRPQTGYAAFSPEIETFLKEHLFADIFERDVLMYAERQLVTVSVLASLGGLEPMMSSHYNICLNVGLTPEQLMQQVNIIELNVGKQEADAARAVLSEVFQNRGINMDFNATKTINGVKIEKVSFPNRFYNNVVGNLHFPPNYDANRKYAAIVVGHPFGGVKEQTSGLHAQKMAELGYITLAFDATHYGESGGYPRYIETPEARVEDFSAAVDFLSNHQNVNADAIGVIGICGGGGYSVSATQIDHRIKALATISMYDMGRARRQGLGDVITYQQRMQTLTEVGEQRTREFRGEPRRNIAAIPTVLPEDATENTREFFDYYRTPRGGHTNSTTSYSFTSLAPMMNHFPFVQIETISPRPLLFIVGERAVSAYFSEDAYSKAAEPKELFVVPGASHVDLYDRPEYRYHYQNSIHFLNNI